jgi:hypothetical protein
MHNEFDKNVCLRTYLTSHTPIFDFQCHKIWVIKTKHKKMTYVPIINRVMYVLFDWSLSLLFLWCTCKKMLLLNLIFKQLFKTRKCFIHFSLSFISAVFSAYKIKTKNKFLRMILFHFFLNQFRFLFVLDLWLLFHRIIVLSNNTFWPFFWTVYTPLAHVIKTCLVSAYIRALLFQG